MGAVANTTLAMEIGDFLLKLLNSKVTESLGVEREVEVTKGVRSKSTISTGWNLLVRVGEC